MGSCQMEIVLDRAGEAPHFHPVYTMGETLSGAVNVRVDARVRCRGLDLDLLYVRRDHHQGKPMVIAFGELEPEHHTRAARVRLFSGKWEAGDHVYRFAVPVPSPASYDGKLSSWTWLAYARVDIPWAADVADRAHFRVQAPPGAGTRYTPLPAVRADDRGPELQVSVSDPAQNYRAGVPQAPVLHCRVVAGPGKAVEHVEVVLVVRETTTRRTGRRSYDMPVHSKLWSHEQQLLPTMDDVYSCEVTLPEPGALPFSTGRDQQGRGVIWELEATIVRASSSASHERTTCEIDVRPNGT